MSLASGVPYWYASDPGTPLRQCEMLSDVEHVTVALADIGKPDEIGVVPTVYPYALILSQDCDMEWDQKNRRALANATEPPSRSDAREAWDAANRKLRAKLMAGVLFCAAEDEATVKAAAAQVGQPWKFAMSNQHERFHLLRGSESSTDAQGTGFPPLVLDFKRFFTLPADELAARVVLADGASGRATRRAFLASPFLEEVSARFYTYQSRVAVPDEARPTD